LKIFNTKHLIAIKNKKAVPNKSIIVHSRQKAATSFMRTLAVIKKIKNSKYERSH